MASTMTPGQVPASPIQAEIRESTKDQGVPIVEYFLDYHQFLIIKGFKSGFEKF